MKLYTSLLLTLLALNGLYAQLSGTPHIQTRFVLKLDSIERASSIYKYGTRTEHFLHHTVKNISVDTLNYITNTCFYYNHCTLKTQDKHMELNEAGGCTFNSIEWNFIPPGESIQIKEWVTDTLLPTLELGEWEATLSIPLVRDKEIVYRIDGRGFVENPEYLVYTGKTKVVSSVTDNRKRKKRKKKKNSRPN